jgi:hypothetical protein
MTTDVGSFKSYQLVEGRTTPVSVRVSPTEKIRAEIDALFGGGRELGEVIEDVARLGARLIIQTALEAEVEVFLGRARYQRSARAEDARPGMRNGYSAATVKTTAGPVTVARPKLRGTTEVFASRLFGTAAAFALPRRDQAMAHQHPVNGGPGWHRAHLRLAQPIQQPARAPPWMRPAQLADQRLHLRIQLTGLRAGPVGMVSQTS